MKSILSGVWALLAVVLVSCGTHEDEHDEEAGHTSATHAAEHEEEHAEEHAEEPGHEEAHTEIDAAMAAAAGVVTALAGPGEIADELLLYGRIAPDAEKMRQVAARFAGPVRSVLVRAGDTVRAGQTLATVESNESLQTYPVTAPISGVVVARNVNVGEITADNALFEIVDYSAVWAELAVFPRDRARLAIGTPIEVRAAEGDLRGSGALRFLSPAGGASSAVTARVVLDNGQRQWTPGQFIEASLPMARHALPVVVPIGALQRMGAEDVVFVNEGTRYQAQPVVPGRRDSQHVEIRQGLTAGTRIVTANSYLVKADIEKSGASHEH